MLNNGDRREGHKVKGRSGKDRKARGRDEEEKEGADPTSTANDVEEKDEAVNSLSGDDLLGPRSPSPTTKRKRDEEMKTMEEDFQCIREAELAKVGVQAKMPTKVPSQLLKLKVRRKTAQR